MAGWLGGVLSLSVLCAWQASWEEFCLEHLPWVKVDCSKGTPTLEKSSDLSGFTVSMPSTVVSGYTPSVPERFTLEIKSAVKWLYHVGQYEPSTLRQLARVEKNYSTWLFYHLKASQATHATKDPVSERNMKFWEKAESGGDAKILKASMQLFSNQDCLTLAEEPRNEKVLFYGNMSKYCPLLLDFVAGQGVLGDDRHMLRHQLTAITKTFLEMRRTVTSQDPHIERMLGGLMRKDMLPFLTTWLCHSADEQDCEAFGNIQ
eukprot:gene20446-24496_t